MARLRLVPRPPSPPLGADDACLDAYLRELDYLHRTLRRLGIAPSEIEDLAQEVFLVLHRNWHDFDGSRPLRPYLFGIAFRIAFAHHRRRGRELSAAALDPEDRAPSPDRALQTRQARALIIGALERVPLPRRAVLVMHDLDDVPVHQVAQVLDIPLFTVYSRLRKARAELTAAVRRLLKEMPIP